MGWGRVGKEVQGSEKERGSKSERASMARFQAFSPPLPAKSARANPLPPHPPHSPSCSAHLGRLRVHQEPPQLQHRVAHLCLAPPHRPTFGRRVQRRAKQCMSRAGRTLLFGAAQEPRRTRIRKDEYRLRRGCRRALHQRSRGRSRRRRMRWMRRGAPSWMRVSDDLKHAIVRLAERYQHQ